MMRNPENTIGNLIDRCGIAMVGSVDGDGFPNVKAMYAPRHRNGIRELYFTTNLSSLRVAQFRRSRKRASISATAAFSAAPCCEAGWKS